jgi:hypothetical protein
MTMPLLYQLPHPRPALGRKAPDVGYRPDSLGKMRITLGDEGACGQVIAFLALPIPRSADSG